MLKDLRAFAWRNDVVNLTVCIAIGSAFDGVGLTLARHLGGPLIRTVARSKAFSRLQRDRLGAPVKCDHGDDQPLAATGGLRTYPQV